MAEGSEEEADELRRIQPAAAGPAERRRRVQQILARYGGGDTLWAKTRLRCFAEPLHPKLPLPD